MAILASLATSAPRGIEVCLSGALLATLGLKVRRASRGLLVPQGLVVWDDQDHPELPGCQALRVISDQGSQGCQVDQAPQGRMVLWG